MRFAAVRKSCLAVLVLGGGLLAGVPARAGSFGASAQGAFTFHGGNEEAYDRDHMNRGDNPFSPVRLLVLTRANVDEDTDLFVELPVDGAATSSLFLTYVRPFARLTRLAGHDWLNVQAGKLPTVFGTYGERSASTGRGLVGTPLLYHYHTAVRPDLVPAGPADFLVSGLRGHGYEPVTGPGGTSFVGVPLIYDACWDAGAELYGVHRGLEFTVAGTQGTVSRPAMKVENYNDGHGVVGRVGYLFTGGPLFGLRFGASGAVGPYLDRKVASDPNFPAGKSVEDYENTALGLDGAFARGPWQFHGELGRVGYQVPNVDPALTATSYYLEVQRDLGPQWTAAIRQEAVAFSTVTDGAGRSGHWDDDVTRWEAGVGYRFRPQARLRLDGQLWHSPDDASLNVGMVALQLMVWTR